MVELPSDALYGANTARGVDNFSISGIRFGHEAAFVRAFALVKMAAARANHELGLLTKEQADALDMACREVVEGLHNSQFIVDLLEGSGGTSLNMNVNEVLANRALIIMGEEPGTYARLHPNDQVNRSQSTNDVLPTVMKITAYTMLAELIEALSELKVAFRAKAAEFDHALRLGCTCLQDAQPMTLGQAFGGYSALTERLMAELQSRRDDLRKLPLGGTAIGTGLGAPAGYRDAAIRHLSVITGVTWEPADNAFDAMQNVDVFGRLSGELKTCAMSLGKIGSDFILLSSGPAGGLGELILPALQAGSSIMPGKVNPVHPMALCQVGFAVAGHDTCITLAVQQGQLEINHYEPLIAAYLFSAIRMMTNETRLFAHKCVAGTRADEERTYQNLINSSATATALVPVLGYDTVAALVRKAARERKTFLETAEEAGHMTEDHAMELMRASVKS